MEALRQYVNEVVAESILPSMVCIVRSVNASAGTCEVIPVDGSAAISDVLLSASPNPEMLITPKVGSEVLVSLLTKHRAVVVLVSTPDKVEINIQGKTFSLDKSGLSFTSPLDSLKGVLTDLISEIKAITVTTAQGPSGPVINQTGFDLISQRLTSFLS